jgi:hypothetical protein
VPSADCYVCWVLSAGCGQTDGRACALPVLSVSSCTISVRTLALWYMLCVIAYWLVILCIRQCSAQASLSESLRARLLGRLSGAAAAIDLCLCWAVCVRVLVLDSLSPRACAG